MRKRSGLIVAAILLLAIAPFFAAPRGGLHDPTELELRIFLFFDGTDRVEFREGFVCRHFAQTLKMNAASAGIRMSVVYVDFALEDVFFGHVVNGVRLANGTLVLVEPQSDKIFPCDALEAHLNQWVGIGRIELRNVTVVW